MWLDLTSGVVFDKGEEPGYFSVYCARRDLLGLAGYPRGIGGDPLDAPARSKLNHLTDAAVAAMNALREIADESPGERSMTAEERLARVREVAERAFQQVERELGAPVRRVSV